MAEEHGRRPAASGVVALSILVLAVAVGPERPPRVGGIVTDAASNPVPGATVRLQATATATTTDEQGRFSIDVPRLGNQVRLTAWAEGYYISGGEEHAIGDEVLLVLTPLHPGDDPGYEWLSYRSRAGPAGTEGEDLGCAACHSRDANGVEADLPVDQWLKDAHGNSASNPRFLSMYLGTDVLGNASPPTRFVERRDYGLVPLRPDPALPYFGPGYRLDFPESFGNCAACHTPAASIGDPYGVNPSTVTGVAAEGIGCDFCHKIWAVLLEPGTGLPFPDRPGVLSFEFRRPPEGSQFFGGPYDDVAPGADTYVPVMSESAFCAPCHRAAFWGIPIYDSYGEWLASPYSDPETGRTCQDCHMPPGGASTFAVPAAGGLERDPAGIPGHLMPGAADEALLGEALQMTVEASRTGGLVEVRVTVRNETTGHHVPTDSPLRHVILLVGATGDEGPLELIEGPVLPAWCGEGDPGSGRYAGMPGRAYAKILEELWTGVSPTGAYWNQTRVVSDNRIPAMGSDTTVYQFSAPESSVAIEVTLLFRRAYIDLADQKGWGAADIVMGTASLTVPSGAEAPDAGG